MARIFISYARKYEGFARKLATSLSADGASIWLDVKDIPVGMNWSSAIQEGLDTADLMIVIITPEAMASQNVEHEWQYFFDEKKPVIPILFVPAKSHYQLRRLQYINFHEEDYDTAYQKLLTELKVMGVHLWSSSLQTSKSGSNPDKNKDTTSNRKSDSNGETSNDANGSCLRNSVIFAAVIGGIFALAAAIFPTVFNAIREVQNTSATETAVALIPTNAPSPTRTNTPTSTSTSSPSATPTSTNTPSPTLTPSALSDTSTSFQRLLARDTNLADALGNRMSPEVYNVFGSTQSFENGLMMWRSDSKDIYVLRDDGTLLIFRDIWTSRMNPLSCDMTPPSDRIQPAYGFGNVWCDNLNVRADLGYATAIEKNYTFSIQSFDNGWLIRLADAVYALTSSDFVSGNWTLVNPYEYSLISLREYTDPPGNETGIGLGNGIEHLLGIPFDVDWKVTTQCQNPFENRPTDIILNANVAYPVEVYLLIQAGWGLSDYREELFGNILLTFSDGGEKSIPLILGFNIRDWSRERQNAVTEASSAMLQPAVEGIAPDGKTSGGADILTIEIPVEYRSSTLETIQIVDSSDVINPCIHLLGVTIRTAQ